MHHAPLRFMVLDVPKDLFYFAGPIARSLEESS
jgi:hypothetical protein